MNSLAQASSSDHVRLHSELQFEPGYAQAFGWLHNLETHEELDRLCAEARMRISRTDPEAA